MGEYRTGSVDGPHSWQPAAALKPGHLRGNQDMAAGIRVGGRFGFWGLWFRYSPPKGFEGREIQQARMPRKCTEEA